MNIKSFCGGHGLGLLGLLLVGCGLLLPALLLLLLGGFGLGSVLLALLVGGDGVEGSAG